MPIRNNLTMTDCLEQPPLQDQAQYDSILRKNRIQAKYTAKTETTRENPANKSSLIEAAPAENKEQVLQDVENHLMVTNNQKKQLESELQKIENQKTKNYNLIRRKGELEVQLAQKVNSISECKRKLKQMGAFYK